MRSFRTHLTVVDESAALYSNVPAFRIPQFDSNDTCTIREWKVVTYQQFQRDVEHFAKYWAAILEEQGIPQRSVVGVWYASIHAHMQLALTYMYFSGWVG